MKLCKKIVEQRTSIIHELGTKNNKLKIKFQMSEISVIKFPIDSFLHSFVQMSLHLRINQSFYFEKRIPNFHESFYQADCFDEIQNKHSRRLVKTA